MPVLEGVRCSEISCLRLETHFEGKEQNIVLSSTPNRPRLTSDCNYKVAFLADISSRIRSNGTWAPSVFLFP